MKMVKILTAATIAVAFTTVASADEKPLGPHSYILTCGIAGPCIWVNGEQPVPVPRPRPKMAIPETETGKGLVEIGAR